MLKRRQRRRIAFAVVTSLGLVIVLFSAEFGARLHVAQQTFFRYPANWPELSKSWDHVTLRLTDGDYFVYGDIHTPLVNIDAGSRRTVGQPAHYAHTLWLFGNSVLEDVYTADSDTLASDLQKLFPLYRVVNLGQNGYLLSAELARLHDTPIQHGDIVIFLDGAPDAEAAFYWCDPSNSRWNSLALATLVCDGLNWTFQSDVQPAVSRYERLSASANDDAQSRGAMFIHIFQADNPSTKSHNAIQRFYGALAFPLPRLYVPESAYVDNVHLNADGNTIAARQVYDMLTLI